MSVSERVLTPGFLVTHLSTRILSLMGSMEGGCTGPRLKLQHSGGRGRQNQKESWWTGHGDAYP